MAVCAKCGANNAPMNESCDICKEPLGSALVEAIETRSALTYVWLSAGLTIAMCAVCWLLGLHPMTMTISMFYGPLLASYAAKENVVWHAALGGLLGVVAIVLFAVLSQWEVTRVVLTGMVGGRAEATDYHPATKVFVVLLVGIPLFLATIMPFSLTGASVGEHLSQWRRNRRVKAILGDQPATKMSDEEIAKVEL